MGSIGSLFQCSVVFRYYRFDGIETASALIIDFKLFVLDNPK